MDPDRETLKHIALTHFLSTWPSCPEPPDQAPCHFRLSIQYGLAKHDNTTNHDETQNTEDDNLPRGWGWTVKFKPFTSPAFCFPVRVIYCHATQSTSHAIHKRLSLAIKETRTSNISWQFTNVDQAMYRHAQYDSKLQTWLSGCVGSFKRSNKGLPQQKRKEGRFSRKLSSSNASAAGGDKQTSHAQTVIVLVAPTVSDCERRKSRLHALKLLPDTSFILVPYRRLIVKDSADDLSILIAQSMRQHPHVFGTNHDMLSIVIMMPEMDILTLVSPVADLAKGPSSSQQAVPTSLNQGSGPPNKQQGKPSLRAFLQTSFSKRLTQNLGHLLSSDTVSDVRWTVKFYKNSLLDNTQHPCLNWKEPTRTIYIVETQQDQERLKTAIPQLDHHPTMMCMMIQIPHIIQQKGGQTQPTPTLKKSTSHQKGPPLIPAPKRSNKNVLPKESMGTTNPSKVLNEPVAQAAVALLMQRIKTLQQTMITEEHYESSSDNKDRAKLSSLNCVVVAPTPTATPTNWPSDAAGSLSLVLRHMAQIGGNSNNNRKEGGQAKVFIRFISPAMDNMSLPSFIVQSFLA